MQIKRLNFIILFFLLIAGIYFLFPWLFKQVAVWQREFNVLLSDNLHQIKQDSVYAGGGLIVISFLYGVFHALGPGHGKFIITGYLSTHQSKLAVSMKLTFLSSLMQGVVAIIATSVIVVALNLSSDYFKLSQLWLERGAFGLILLLGIHWCYQSLKKFWRTSGQAGMPRIQGIKSADSNLKIGQSAVENPQKMYFHHQHDEHCGCGHQHLPEQSQLDNSDSLKSQLLVILSIGMRPCTGAIFILFLSYMLELYYWGIIATMAMSLGTGITLSAFALLVLYARQTAVKLGKWYLSPKLKTHFGFLLKFCFGILLIVFGAGLIYETTLPSSGGAVLLGR
ncbi:MAG TPA: cobalt transporter [Pasteurellaceae bacterium]|nr:cobalt transporter [Pasteurellaceae bacterium]